MKRPKDSNGTEQSLHPTTINLARLRFVPELDEAEVVPEASSLGGLLNRSSLMDVPFRGMQRQHLGVYLAALDDPSAEGLDSQINFQTYAGRDLSEFEDWGVTGVCTCCKTTCLFLRFGAASSNELPSPPAAALSMHAVSGI